jgi:hypothetical protein
MAMVIRAMAMETAARMMCGRAISNKAMKPEPPCDVNTTERECRRSLQSPETVHPDGGLRENLRVRRTFFPFGPNTEVEKPVA